MFGDCVGCSIFEGVFGNWRFLRRFLKNEAFVLLRSWLDIEYDIPDITLSYDDVLDRALSNSSFSLNQELQYIQAEQSVAQAKANRGIQASVNARYNSSG